MNAKEGLLLAALAMVVVPGVAAADSPSSAVLASTCFSCHGTDGKSVGAMPSLAGKSVTYIAQTMRKFRSGEQESTVMGRIAKGFSEAEIDALAAYLGGK